MKKIKVILMAAIALVLVSCGGGSGSGSYEGAALNFVKTAGEYNAEMSTVMQEAMKSGKLDQEAWVAKGEKVTNTLLGMSCYNSELLSDDNEKTMRDKLSKKMYKIEMVSCEVLRSAELRDGTVAYVEIKMLKRKDSSVTSTEGFIMRKIDGSWKVEVNNWGNEIFEIKKEFDAKMAEIAE